MALDEAEAAVEALLERHRSRPGATLLIIHGRSTVGPDSIRTRVTRHLQGKWRSRIRRSRADFLNPGALWVEIAG